MITRWNYHFFFKNLISEGPCVALDVKHEVIVDAGADLDDGRPLVVDGGGGQDLRHVAHLNLLLRLRAD